MAKFFKRHNKSKTLESVTKGSLESIFRPYYINDEKIDNFFEQEYGPIEQFTKTEGKNYVFELSGGVKNTSLTSLLLELITELKAGGGKSSSDAKTYKIPTVLRFNFLRKYWEHDNRLLDLSNADFNTLKRHTFVYWLGKYRFAEHIEDLAFSISEKQEKSIRQQKDFEEKSEGTHYLYFIKTPEPAISILADRFISHTGRRYLMHPFPDDDSTLFVGAVIGITEGILFLDPIAIGEDVFRDRR